MKNKLFKTLVIFGLSFIAWNCSDDPASPAIPNPGVSVLQPKPTLEVDQNSWLLNTGSQNFLIIPNGTAAYVVTDANSIPVGTFDVATGSIIDDTGTPIVVNIDLSTLPIVSPDKTISYPDGSKYTIDGQTILLPGGIDPNTSPVINSSSSIPGKNPITSSSSITNPIPTLSSSSNKVEQPQTASSSSKKTETGNVGSITYTGSLSQTVAQGKAISPVSFSGLKGQPSRQSWNAWFINDSDCKYDANAKTFTIAGNVHESFPLGEVSETWIIDGSAITLTLNVTNGSGNSQNQDKVSSSSQKQDAKSSSSRPKSSSSQPKSSSSQAKSSSSKAVSSSSATPTNPNLSEPLKYVSGGKSGDGWATRYWDCCKPSCSWSENANGNPTKQCTNKGTSPSTDWGAGSICSGGPMMTCTSQIPIIVNENLAYAFAAVPAADGGSCGKCFALEFTGKGKYETKANHAKLTGKILVVMATNVGTDVEKGQFDVMIPGGGVGIFNGCASMGWGDMGEQYGGLLSQCEREVGYSGDLLTKRVNCLTEKCGKTFGNDAKAKEGCMFLATWMYAAGNPTHNYREVECPAALKAQY